MDSTLSPGTCNRIVGDEIIIFYVMPTAGGSPTKHENSHTVRVRKPVSFRGSGLGLKNLDLGT
jgi:hypothetical protein